MTMNRPIAVFVAVIFCLFVASSAGCRPIKAGGECTYDVFVGTATITKIEPIEGSAPDGAVRVVFDTQFSGSKPTPKFYQHKDRAVVIKSPDGKTDAEWLAAQKLTVDSKLRVEVSLITSGTCTPVIFAFPTLPDGALQD